ncbi:MAG: M24 family metallopeptidase [Acidobacteriota bacterium]|nr:M24 family metallopeptidase [Acidobacteriota bacterium]
MTLDVEAVQRVLREDDLDGWLLYDFHGSNPVARRLAGLATGTKLTTRRWYYLIPAHGIPRGLVHAIERDRLDHLPGYKTRYAGHGELASGLRALLTDCETIAMEYSPGCAIPYISRVDGGTIDAIRALGLEIRSSGDLIQRFEAVWDASALATHEAAASALYAIKDHAFELVSARLRDEQPVTEFEVQEAMTGWFTEAGLVSDSRPVVAAQENAGDPHYLPTEARHRTIGTDEVLLLDLWGKLDRNGAVYADITWMGFTGSCVPARYADAFATIRDARDVAVALIEHATRDGRELRGWEVDRDVRSHIETAGLGDHFVHRTGHSLGEEVHGNGVHLDDFETHDDRRLLAGTGITVEPGVYFPEFGLRTEINVYVGTDAATVTGPLQTDIRVLG